MVAEALLLYYDFLISTDSVHLVSLLLSRFLPLAKLTKTKNTILLLENIHQITLFVRI